MKSLKSMNRLLLTGTPLQNNLAELWSLLNFLLPEVFNDLAVFESWFDVKELQHEQGTMKFLQQEEEKKVVSSLREILKPFMLRRVKNEVCLDIPPKKEIIVYAPITELQRDLYKAVLNRDLQTLCKIENEPLIIDVNGKRPKRKCVLKKDIDKIYSEALYHDSDDNVESPISNDDNDIDWNPNDEFSNDFNFNHKIIDLQGPSTSLSNNIELKNQNVSDLDIEKLHLMKNESSMSNNYNVNNFSSRSEEQKLNNLTLWKQYTDVNERNRDFFIHITFGSRCKFYLYNEILIHILFWFIFF